MAAEPATIASTRRYSRFDGQYIEASGGRVAAASPSHRIAFMTVLGSMTTGVAAVTLARAPYPTTPTSCTDAAVPTALVVDGAIATIANRVAVLSARAGPAMRVAPPRGAPMIL